MGRFFRIASIVAMLCFVWGLVTPVFGHAREGRHASAQMANSGEDADANDLSASYSGVKETPGEKKTAKKFPWLLAGLGVAAAAVAVVLLTGRKKSSTDGNDIEFGTVTDIDGNVYRTVRIGSQEWMAENLKTRHEVGGSLLAGAYAYCKSEANVSAYGRLYTWDSAMLPLINGWHLPSGEEWTTLIEAVGISTAGSCLKEGGTCGFNAKFGGSRFYDGSYNSLGERGHYWSSTLDSVDHALIVNFFPEYASVPRSAYGIVGAISVRLVKDE